MRVATPAERFSLEEAGCSYLRHLEIVRGRKRSTIEDYESILRRHLVPFFGDRALDRVTSGDVTACVQVKRRAGLARQTVINHVNLLHGICGFAQRRGWVNANPVVGVERPRAVNRDPDIRFLSIEELEALLRAVPDDSLGRVERVLYLMAAMTGLRQGEARGASLAGHRLERGSRARPPQLQPRRARHAEVTAIAPRRAAR